MIVQLITILEFTTKKLKLVAIGDRKFFEKYYLVSQYILISWNFTNFSNSILHKYQILIYYMHIYVYIYIKYYIYTRNTICSFEQFIKQLKLTGLTDIIAASCHWLADFIIDIVACWWTVLYTVGNVLDFIDIVACWWTVLYTVGNVLDFIDIVACWWTVLYTSEGGYGIMRARSWGKFTFSHKLGWSVSPYVPRSSLTFAW